MLCRQQYKKGSYLTHGLVHATANTGA